MVSLLPSDYGLFSEHDLCLVLEDAFRSLLLTMYTGSLAAVGEGVSLAFEVAQKPIGGSHGVVLPEAHGWKSS